MTDTTNGFPSAHIPVTSLEHLSSLESFLVGLHKSQPGILLHPSNYCYQKESATDENIGFTEH